MQIKRGGGGFTLAELLIVMAIIVVLAAIAIPTFGKQLETARETADAEAIRAAATDAFTQAYAQYITNAEKASPTDDWKTQVSAGIKMTQKTDGFEYITPTIKVGSGVVTVLTFEDVKQGTAITSAPTVYFFFGFEEETGGQGGIKLTSIKFASAEDAAANAQTDATVAKTT